MIAYWVSREKDEPGNAFCHHGEMANEAARVCIDAGDLDGTAQWYRKGHDPGLREPGISADRKAVWEFRLRDAEARIAARRGDRAEAEKHAACAKAALESMTDSRRQQAAFFHPMLAWADSGETGEAGRSALLVQESVEHARA